MLKKRVKHEHGQIKKDVSPELSAKARRWAPLPASFMVASIIGFLISVVYIPRFSSSLAAAFAVVFFCMLIASLISMERASPDEQLAAKPIK